jgi:hypothetical protein
MTDARDDRPADRHPPDAAPGGRTRKPYARPRLVEHGSVRRLTEGSGGTRMDKFNPNKHGAGESQ